MSRPLCLPFRTGRQQRLRPLEATGRHRSRSSRGDHASGLTGAETYWARNLRELGIATFAVNSFSGRNMTRSCSGRDTISMASLLTNVYRAYDLLAVHPRIDPSQIALMGFSLGGRTALWANQKRFQQRYGPSRVTTFAAYLAFYPASCHIKLAEEERVSDAP